MDRRLLFLIILSMCLLSTSNIINYAADRSYRKHSQELWEQQIKYNSSNTSLWKSLAGEKVDSVVIKK